MRVVCLAIALAACGAAPPPPVIATPVSVPVPPAPPADAAVDAAPTGIAAALATLTELTEAMCRCGDSACANRLAEDMRTWGQALNRPDDEQPPTEDEQQQLAALSSRLATCMTAAMTSPAPGSPP
jgi:hypothetical protein